jgi:hypothetical protein
MNRRLAARTASLILSGGRNSGLPRSSTPEASPASISGTTSTEGEARIAGDMGKSSTVTARETAVPQTPLPSGIHTRAGLPSGRAPSPAPRRGGSNPSGRTFVTRRWSKGFEPLVPGEGSGRLASGINRSSSFARWRAVYQRAAYLFNRSISKIWTCMRRSIMFQPYCTTSIGRSRGTSPANVS